MSSTLDMIPESMRSKAISDIEELQRFRDYNSPAYLERAISIYWTLRNIVPSDQLIQYSEIHSYNTLYNTHLTPMEIDTIVKLDREYISEMIEVQKK